MTAPASNPVPDPPSTRHLLKSTGIALTVAVAILVTIVLPAEYGVDPTGVGKVLGLKEMGEIKRDLAEEAAADKAAAAQRSLAQPPPAAAPAPATAADKSDVTVVTIPPTQAREIKLVMTKDAGVTYLWRTNRGVVNYDLHADAPGIRYHGYTKGTATPADSGSLVAAFDGQHGWFWRNRSADTVVVTLRTTGRYSAVKQIQ